MELEALHVRDGFRLRGEQVTRLETFVDAAFAFSLTLIVISAGSLPSNLGELQLALHRIPSFAPCFALMTLFWAAHDRWSRRFAIGDGTPVLLSLFFVFVMLIYVYPMRMVISSGLHFMTHGWVPAEMSVVSTDELASCFLIYGAGFTVLSLIIILLQQQALSRSVELELDELEILKTRQEIGTFAIFVFAGLFSMVLAIFLRHPSSPGLSSLPGFAYMLVPVLQIVYHSGIGRSQRKLEQSGRFRRVQMLAAQDRDSRDARK